MNIAALYSAIHDVVRSDTGAGGLFGDPPLVASAWPDEAPNPDTQRESYPTVVYSAFAAGRHGYTVDVYDVVVRMHVYVLTASIDPIARASRICQRLIALFHRANPPAIGDGWVISPMYHTDTHPEPEPGIVHHVVEFRTLASRS